jgi:hypothetical protein
LKADWSSKNVNPSAAGAKTAGGNGAKENSRGHREALALAGAFPI